MNVRGVVLIARGRNLLVAVASVDDCLRACVSTPACQYAARSSSGYCHYFETCTPGSRTGWTRWRKTVKGGNEGPVSTLELQPPKKGLSGPAAKSSPQTGR